MNFMGVSCSCFCHPRDKAEKLGRKLLLTLSWTGASLFLFLGCGRQKGIRVLPRQARGLYLQGEVEALCVCVNMGPLSGGDLNLFDGGEPQRFPGSREFRLNAFGGSIRMRVCE